jgi:hypothetical protein
MQNKAVFYFHFDVFIFDNKVAGGKMQLGEQFARLLWNALEGNLRIPRAP